MGFPNDMADTCPALMVENHALVWPILRVPSVGNLQEVSIGGEQSPGRASMRIPAALAAMVIAAAPAPGDESETARGTWRIIAPWQRPAPSKSAST